MTTRFIFQWPAVRGFVLLAIALLLAGKMPAQHSGTGLTSLKHYASDQYGTSDILVNGWKYYPEHFNAKGDPYFNELGWMTGLVETTEGTFDDLLLRYNVQMNELILQKTLKSGETAYVMLNPDFVKSFDIGYYHFVNAGNQALHPSLNSYVEVIYDGGIKYLAEHSKMFVASYTVNSPQGSISGQNTDYMLIHKEQLHKISSRRSLYKLFPENKKQIRQYLRKQKIKFKRADREEIIKVMKYLDSIL